MFSHVQSTSRSLLRPSAAFLMIMICFLIGCGEEESPSSTASAGSESAMTDTADKTNTESTAAEPESQPVRNIPPLQLNSVGSSSSTATTNQEQPSVQSVLEALKPLQVMLGQWRGTTRRVFGNFNAVDEHEWVFDLQTDPAQPALVMVSDKSPYIQNARLTFVTETGTFQLTVLDRDQHERVLTGTYTQPVEDKFDDSQVLQRTYKLELKQKKAGDAPDRWQITLNHQENNRYLLQLARSRGQQTDFRVHDTVSIQRKDTSFALSDTDYGDKECIISQGLGTTAVSFQGKTYWVCCSGCKAAFEEDPELWIARAAEREESAKK